jgi:hypothetical protein
MSLVYHMKYFDMRADPLENQRTIRLRSVAYTVVCVYKLRTQTPMIT